MGTTLAEAMLVPSTGNHDSIAIMPSGNLVRIVPKTTTSFRVYETPDRATAWTQRATVTTATMDTKIKYAVSVGHDGTYIMLTYVAADHSIKNRRITYGGAWTVGAEETASAAIGGLSIRCLDTDVSLGGALVVAAPYIGGVGDLNGYLIRVRSTAGTWSATAKVTVDSTATIKTNVVDSSVGWYESSLATARRFTFMHSWGSGSLDKGVTHYHMSINENDGTGFSSKTVGVLTAGTITYSSADTFASSPRQVRVRGLVGEPLQSAIAVSSSSKFSGGHYPEHSAGIAKITTLGANAAADVVTTNIFSSLYTDAKSTLSNGGIAITFAYDYYGMPSFNFINSVTYPAVAPSGTTTKNAIASRVLAIRDHTTSSPAIEIRRGGQWDNRSAAAATFSGGKKFDGTNRRHDMLLHFANGDTGHSWAPTLTVDQVKPAANEIVSSSKPLVGGRAVIPPSTNILAQDFYPRTVIANDAGFTAGVQSSIGAVKTFGNYSSSSSRQVYDTPWTGAAVGIGTKFAKASIIDVYGNESAAVATATSFTITHPGSVKNVQPPYSLNDPTGFSYSDPGGLGHSKHPISWEFSDAWVEDFQTAYKVTLINPVTAAVVYDSGKVVSSDKNTLVNIPLAEKNAKLDSYITTWDSYDTSETQPVNGRGSIRSYTSSTFDTLVCTTVDGSNNVNSNNPIFSYTFTQGLYEIVSLDIVVTKANVVVGSATLRNPATSGTLKVPTTVENNKSYTVTATLTDVTGLKTTRVLPINTLWALPAAPAGVTALTTQYNIENAAYVEVQWNDTTKEADWIAWNIYRQVDEINVNTNAVVKTGPLKLIATTATSASLMSYYDYLAPAGVKITYIVRQVVDRNGAVTESSNVTGSSVFTTSEGYWLIDPTPEDPTNASFQLFSVIQDDYTHKYESQITHIIGRGNHEDRGDDLGREGSITAQLRDNTASTARMKRIRIEAMKSEVRSLYLRNPYGDMWPVSVGDIGISRIAGVGRAEFVDLTIPYTEVY